MNGKKKKIIIGSLLALLLIPTIAAFAVVYISNSEVNKFDPAKADMQVKEGNNAADTSEALEKEYTLSSVAENKYAADKPVQIVDGRSNTGEALRVSFIPMWLDAEGNVCAGIAGVTDIRSIELDSTANTLTYYSGEGDGKSAVFTLILADGWSTDWTYQKEGCFYYHGSLNEDRTTSPLIAKVELSKAVYDASEGLDLRLDVLADTIQVSADADSQRSWGDYNND